MRRAVLVLVGLIVALAAMFAPVVFASSDDAASGTESATITDYQAQFDVARDGTLRATETLRVDFPLYRHGIFRFFDVVDPNNPDARLVPKDIGVTRDGRPDGLDVSTESGGRYVVAKIGDADETITGSHVYVITYTVPGALSAPLSGRDGAQFYWNLIPGGWQMPIERSALTVNLPAAPQDTRCAVGAASDTGCTATTTGKSLMVVTGALEPHTPVTVQSSLDVPAPGRVSVPWSVTLDPVLGRSVWLVVVIGVLAVVAGIAAWLIVRTTHESSPAFPLMYGPPEGIGPAQGAYLLTETVTDDHFAATMLQLGEAGVATLEKDGTTWRISGKDGNWDALDTVTRQAASTLGIAPGQTFVADPDDAEGGKSLRESRRAFDGSVSGWARTAGLMERAGLGGAGRVLLVVGVIAAAVFYFINPFDRSMFGLPFAVFAVVAVPVLAPGAMTFRTKRGRDVWSQLGGFRRVLGTPSSEARFDFSGRHELYTKYIPWAVAFDVADEWAEKYRVANRQEPPTPGYLNTGHGLGVGYGLGSMSSFSSDFTSSVASSISSYEATQQSSSSSGGGGFSGGGGGGGGGGGSW
ncbi:DUF2207 domain-containing protein [Williamsia sp. Leaf354]|uniref:DUF2207 domain-containing protein n=1 Tax=Williamsia sp. Leaf354 TaxID=1736349 RepID=UPI0009EAA942|nr:DUF2207 domain-containing protein [Williamsia sp. Leaf354]